MKFARADTVPAVVVGAGINGLGVLRSLARARVPVIVLGTEPGEPAMRSRHGRKVVYRDDAPDAVIRALEALAGEIAGERPVLMLTQEDTVSCVSAHRDRLESLYRMVLPAHDVLLSLMHKDGFRAMAETAGEAIPRTLHITAPDEIGRIRALQPPLVVKPSIRDADYSSAFRKAYRIDTVDQGHDLVRRILPTLPDVLVQEWIDGLDSDIYFCLQYITSSGDNAASFVGRKIRSWPPYVGGTASCAPASNQETQILKQRTAKFFCHADIRGFASMEYKRDVRSGEFFMIEPTLGRTDFQEEVATLNGVNIPLAAYQTELGLPQKNRKVQNRVRIWRDYDADLQAAAQMDSNKIWKPDSAQSVDALWRASDPVPSLSGYTHRAMRRAKRLLGD